MTSDQRLIQGASWLTRPKQAQHLNHPPAEIVRLEVTAHPERTVHLAAVTGRLAEIVLTARSAVTAPTQSNPSRS